MQQELVRIDPRKVKLIGVNGVASLIRSGVAVATKHRLADFRSGSVLIALMFSLGHGCSDDPLFPWISKSTLRAGADLGSTKLAALDAQALLWLQSNRSSLEPGSSDVRQRPS